LNSEVLSAWFGQRREVRAAFLERIAALPIQ